MVRFVALRLLGYVLCIVGGLVDTLCGWSTFVTTKDDGLFDLVTAILLFPFGFFTWPYLTGQWVLFWFVLGCWILGAVCLALAGDNPKQPSPSR